MSLAQDLMSAPEFADDALTEAINIPPNVTGRLAQLGLFSDVPIATTYVRVGITDGDLAIIPARERGGPANKAMGRDKKRVLIDIPHFPLDDAIEPTDFQNLLAWGEDRVFETFGGVLNGKLVDLRSKHDLTHAHLDWGAISGVILDAEGKELLDIYETFGISQQTFDMVLGTAGTDVASKSRALKSAVRRELKGAPMTGIRILASPEYFDAYTGHANVKDAYRYFASNTQNPNRDGLEDGFVHAGLTIERVDEEFTKRLGDGSLETAPVIPAGEARVIPMGTPYFRRYVAPPDTIADANRKPSPTDKVFVSTAERDHGKGYDIHSESNVLPVNLRPSAVLRLALS
jgi:hypothetical protein